MNAEEAIATLEQFRALLREWTSRRPGRAGRDPGTIRSEINQGKSAVRQVVIEQGCLKTLTIGPPPAIGGLIMRNVDPFDLIFDPPYGQSLIPIIVDMLDETIGAIRRDPNGTAAQADPSVPSIMADIVKNYAFVAMPMDPTNHQLGDVLDAIKEAAKRCDVQAERVDDVACNERITDRIF